MGISQRHRFKFIIGAVVVFSAGYAYVHKNEAHELRVALMEVLVADTREHVRELLGKPEGRGRSHVRSGFIFGPTEGLSSILQPGTPYEQWQWSDERNTYYVWLASKNQESPEEWLVVAKGHYPTDAVF